MNRPWLRRLWSALSTGRQRRGHRRPTFRLHLEPLEERTLPSGIFPFVQSINRLTPTSPTTNAATVSYAVTFSEPVTGVDPTDFKLVSTGTVGTTLTQVTPVSQSVYTVTVSGITGNGTLGLNLVDDGSIRDLAGNPLTQQNAAAHFSSGPFYLTGSAPTSAVLADVTNDGIPDLVVSNERSNSVSVLLGNGNGTFKPQQTFAAGALPFSVAVGDINGDGKLDIAVANEFSQTVSVLLGNGNGTFQGQQTYAVGGNPNGVVLGDLNGDGQLDLAVTNGVTVSVFLGNGNGTFKAQQTYAVGGSPNGVVLGDLNGDGNPDLIFTNRASNILCVLLGNGDGTFHAQQTFSTGTSPLSAAVGDLSGDGKPDIVVANPGSNTVSVLLGNGNGTFQTRQTFATGRDPTSVAMADLNGDGKPDLVVTNKASNTVSVLMGNGNGTFQTQQTFTTDYGNFAASSVILGDTNGDGKPDLVVANYQGYTVCVLLGKGDGTFRTPQNSSTGVFPRSVALGDFNRDGKLDAVVVNQTSNTVSVLMGNGNGTFQAQQTFTTGDSPISAAIGDVNGDGKPDLVVANSNDNTLSILLGNGNGSFQSQQTFASGYYHPTSIALGDLNGDGKPDIVVTNRYSQVVSVLMNSGNGAFQAARNFATGIQPFAVVMGDVNGDGKPDLVVANYGGAVSVLLGNGNGIFQAQQTFSSGGEPTSVVLADVNGDGKPDMVAANYNSNTLGVLLGNGNGTFQNPEILPFFSRPYAVVASDFNGDGKTDLVVGQGNRFVTSNTLSVLLGNGNGTFQSQDNFVVGQLPLSLAVGDVNNDGWQDVVVADALSNTVYTLLNSSTGNFTGQTYTIDTIDPYVVSINRATPAGPATNATSVSFTVTFSEPVTGVDPTVFQVADTGTVGTTLTQVTPVSTSVYTVTVSGITGNGTLGLNLVDDGSIRDLAGNPLTQIDAPAAFLAEQSFAVGFKPSVVAIGDVNGDGKPDLVVANYEQNGDVIVLLANGNGTVQAQRHFAAEAGPLGISEAMGDLNGDGIPDIVVADRFDKAVTVLLGLGNGTFQAPQAFAYSLPSSVTIGDFNGDGKPDLVVTNSRSTVGVLLGNGNGTFQFPRAFAAGTAPISVAAGDVNGDGNLDLIVANYYGSRTVSVLLGNGNGTFQPPKAFPTGFGSESVMLGGLGSYSVVLGDFNGDGKPDIAVAIGNSNVVSVLLGNGNGTFQAQRAFATGFEAHSVAVADVNGDGKSDLIVANYGMNTVSVLLGNGNGTFQAQQTFGVGASPYSVAFGDLNGNGKPDLVVANRASNTVSVLFNAANGDFTGQTYTIVNTAGTTHFAVTATTSITADNIITLTVTAEDQFNNVASAYGGTVAFSGSDSAATLPGNSALTNGVGVFSATLITAGSQSLIATDISFGGITGSATVHVNGAFATHFAIITSTNTPTAGVPFVIGVIAEDQFGNTATGYSGTVHFSGTDLKAVLPADGALSGGVGFFPVILKTAGNQIITATDTVSGGISGSSNAIVVSPAAVTRFAVSAALPSYPGTPVGPSSFASTAVPFRFTITALDPFGNTVPHYAGTVHFASSDTGSGVVLPADSTLVSGTGGFSATLMTPGLQTLTASDTSTGISGTSGAIATRGLVVTSFTPTPTGFTVTFNNPFNPNVVNIYTQSPAALADDVVLATVGSQVSVRGSVLFTPPTNVGGSPSGFTFVKTDTVNATGFFNPGGGILVPGIYTLTLRSFSASGGGFMDFLGGLLDGTNSGIPGANFQMTFSVSAPPVIVGIPDFARGFSNADAIFLPTTLTNGSTFVLSYTNPAANPATGSATITFSTTAATLQGNIQAALTSGGLATQIGVGPGGAPNAVVVVTNDTSSGANLLVTFQNALAQATSQLLASNTSGVAIAPATIDAANNMPGSGIPIALSSGSSVTSGSFTLRYNPSLLTISGVVPKIAGASFTLVSNDTVNGLAVLSLSSPSSISATNTPIILGSLLATVPLSATANYGAIQLLHFGGEMLNGTAGPIPVTNRDGVQVVAYFGDVLGAGGPLSLLDASNIAALAGEIPSTGAQTIPGFAAFPNLDPAIVGDISLQGTVNFTDAGAMVQEVGGTSRGTIPYVPIGLQTTPQLGPSGSPGAASPKLHSQGIISPASAVIVPQQPTVFSQIATLSPIAPASRWSAVELVFAHPEPMPAAPQEEGAADTGSLLDAEFFSLKQRGRRRN